MGSYFSTVPGGVRDKSLHLRLVVLGSYFNTGPGGVVVKSSDLRLEYWVYISVLVLVV